MICCEECGKKLNKNDKFCPNCGNPIEQKLTCPECNHIINEDDKICNYCGYPLKEDKPTKILTKEYTEEDLYVKCPKCKKKQLSNTSTCIECGNTLLTENMPSYIYMNMLICQLSKCLKADFNIKTLKYNNLKDIEFWIRDYYKKDFNHKITYNNLNLEINQDVRKIIFFQYKLINKANEIITKLNAKYYGEYYKNNMVPKFLETRDEYFIFASEICKFLGENTDLGINDTDTLVENVVTIFKEDYTDNLEILAKKFQNDINIISNNYKKQMDNLNTKVVAREMGGLYAANNLFEASIVNISNIATLDSESSNLKNQLNTNIDSKVFTIIDNIMYNLKCTLYDFINMATLTLVPKQNKEKIPYYTSFIKNIYNSEIKEKTNDSFEEYPYIIKYELDEIDNIEENNFDSFINLLDSYGTKNYIIENLQVEILTELKESFDNNKKTFNFNNKTKLLSKCKNINEQEIIEDILNTIVKDKIKEPNNSNKLTYIINKNSLIKKLQKFNNILSKEYLEKIINQIKNDQVI